VNLYLQNTPNIGVTIFRCIGIQCNRDKAINRFKSGDYVVYSCLFKLDVSLAVHRH